MKKILWLSHLLPYPPKGGVLQRSYNLIKEVSKEYEVTILAFNQSGLCETDEAVRLGREHLSKFCNVVEVIQIESDRNPLRKLLLLFKGLMPWWSYTMLWLESTRYRECLNELLTKENFDLIHVDTISLAPYVSSLLSYKKVLNHHNVESLMMLRRASNERNLLKKFYFYQEGIKLKLYERSLCKQFDLNLVCSSLDVDRLVSIVPDIACIDIPNGVDLNYFGADKSVTAIPKSMIFAGGLTWYPNLDAMTFFLKSVWPLLVERDPEVTMTVIGRNPPDWMVEMQSSYKNLNVTGFVDDVRPYFDNASVYVCPIRDGGGTKLKVLDALAMSKPLVAHPVACEGIDVIDGENVFFAESPSEYVEMICRIFQDAALMSSAAGSARDLIEAKYDFVKIGERLRKEYAQLI